MNYMIGILIPFFGTAFGAAGVFFLKNEMKASMQKMLLGFASGVMVAASVWSLLIPAMNMESSMGKFAFVPAAVGFLLGILFLLLMDEVVPHLHLDQEKPEGPKNTLAKSTMLILAVTLHNFPEGMAAGVVYAGVMSENSTITMAGAAVLSLGIAIQNFPEGAIISMPLLNTGIGKGKAFLYGVLSGMAEPFGAVITIIFASHIAPILPYFLSFAAGAMIYVVVEELIPESAQGKHSNLGTIGFAAGFVLMMILDVALG